jgi:hypothetical protein
MFGGTVSPPSLMTVPPIEAALHAFDENAFLMRATGTFERPPIEPRVTRLNPRKVHLRYAFWAPRAIVHVRACRRVFELRHVRLQAGYRRELLPDPQPPAPSQKSRTVASNSPRKGAAPIVTPIPQHPSGRSRHCSALSPRCDHESIFPAAAFLASESTAGRCSIQSRVGWDEPG